MDQHPPDPFLPLDWTMPQMSGWKESLNSLAVQPIQQFRYTVGQERHR